MKQVPSKVIALVGSSGFNSGYGHLRRLVSLSSVLKYSNMFCLHGNFEETKEFYSVIEGSSELNRCKCDLRPATVIFDSYSAKVLSALEFKNSPKLIQLVDELSPKLWADAYIKASPTRDWMPLNELAQVKEFKNSPILRREFFSNNKDSVYSQIEVKSILVLTGSSSLSKQALLYLSEVFSSLLSGFTFVIATNDEKLGEFSKSIGFVVTPYLNDFRTLVNNYRLVVSAGGVTAWELLKLNSNCVILSMADNQNFQLEYLKKHYNVIGLKFDPNNLSLKTELRDAILKSLNPSEVIKVHQSPKIHDGAVDAVDWLRELNYI
jgi:spore coat polysaccharide biosynthesis predicted glycosyltransferase SpsG